MFCGVICGVFVEAVTCSVVCLWRLWCELRCVCGGCDVFCGVFYGVFVEVVTCSVVCL